MARKYTKRDVERLKRLQREAREWAWRTRRLAALKLAWFRTVCRPNVENAGRGRRLHANELAQRQVKADLWKSVPDCTRFVGDGGWKMAAHKDAERLRCVERLEYEATNLHNLMCEVRNERYHRRKGKVLVHFDPTPEPPEMPVAQYTMELENLPALKMKPIMAGIKPGQTPKRAGGVPPVPAGRPPPMTPSSATYEGALEFFIPFGKYEGMCLGDLLDDGEGLSYLWWLSEEAEIKSERFAEAVAIVYKCELARENRWD